MTKKTIYFLLILTPVLSCKQKTEQKFYSEKFNWEIIIPKEFEKMNIRDSEALEKKGIDALSKNYEEEIEKNTRIKHSQGNENPFVSDPSLVDTLNF